MKLAPVKSGRAASVVPMAAAVPAAAVVATAAVAVAVAAVVVMAAVVVATAAAAVVAAAVAAVMAAAAVVAAVVVAVMAAAVVAAAATEPSSHEPVDAGFRDSSKAVALRPTAFCLGGPYSPWRFLRPRPTSARSSTAFGSSRISLATIPICQGITR